MIRLPKVTFKVTKENVLWVKDLILSNMFRKKKTVLPLFQQDFF